MKLKNLLAVILAIAPAALAQPVAGLWQATLTTRDAEVPFRLEIAGNGANVQGWFFNGDQKVHSTSGRFENGKLVLNFDQYASKLEATLKNGVLEGTYGRSRVASRNAGRGANSFRATINTPQPKGQPPTFLRSMACGRFPSPRAGSTGNLPGASSCASPGRTSPRPILRIDGDTGALTGTYQDGKFVLSHFSGGRPARLEVTPAGDGTLDLVLRDGHAEVAAGNRLKAVRPAQARAQGLPVPSDASLHTGVKDPNERFHFRFPDLNGQIVSDGDARFQGKVVLVNVTGSWCPNCHDESPYLAELYRKYHKAGLEIVAAEFRGGGATEGPHPFARLREAVWNRVSGIAWGHAGPSECQATPGGQSQLLADDVLSGPQRPDPQGSRRLRGPRHRRVEYAPEGGIHHRDRAPAGGKGRALGFAKSGRGALAGSISRRTHEHANKQAQIRAEYSGRRSSRSIPAGSGGCIGSRRARPERGHRLPGTRSTGGSLDSGECHPTACWNCLALRAR